ncbi:MAG TPA: RNA 2',3'-cyclic phosphodiesterase [Gemmata sp.]|jgi:2'-5' RNA ligase|nr:RNA 2',3'-cyclic phosphodiesterase [Gemmata sp.]
MGRTRTFIAVDIGDGIRNNAIGLQELLAKTGADVKWVTPESLHITLLFLGEVDDREWHTVCRAVRDIAAGEPPFPLRVSGVGAFPTIRHPKIAWAGIVDGADELRRLHAKLEAKMLDLGCYRKEEREYTPHLTLGRVKGEADGFKLAPELTKRLGWEGGRTVVDEVLVFSSELEKDGPIYTVLGRGKLTGKPG